MCFPLRASALIYTRLSPFKEMENAVIGVEASDYLLRLTDEYPEPLLAALGGFPLALEKTIENELNHWKTHKMRPLFVFDGQPTVGQVEMEFRAAKTALETTKTAWDLYGDNKPTEAVKAFGSAGAVRPRDLYPILQDVLYERGLEFIVAPFSACAQLAYLNTLEIRYIDGVMGSRELLLFNIDDALMFTPTSSDWDQQCFRGISKLSLIKKLNITPNLLVDAILMTGTSFLPQFPQGPQITGTSTSFTISDAFNILRAHGKSIIQACNFYSNDEIRKYDPEWLDNFQKARMAIDHCITINEKGQYHVKDYDTLTADHPSYIGLQTTSELYHYLQNGLIGARIISCLTWLDIQVYPTLDGVDSEEYKQLITTSLLPLQAITSALIAKELHFVFIKKEINVRFWFDEKKRNEKLLLEELQQPREKTRTWGVKDVELNSVTGLSTTKPGRLSFAVLALQDSNFFKKTKSSMRVVGLKSTSEVLSNAIWRFMHLRGYTNDDHELSTWGKALATTFKAISPIVQKFGDVHHLEEAAFLAFELLRFGNLNSRNPHTKLIGGPLRGTDEQKASCMLVSRTACLLKLRHESLGYTGPLSKNFLSFYSIIKAVREADRDMVEAVAAQMFLSNEAIRERDPGDYRKLGQSLPFGTDVDIGLGIAVKTYLDDNTSPEAPKITKEDYAGKYLPHGINISEDLDVAFDFFDALYEGIKTLSTSEVPQADRKAWDEAKKYLIARR
ncbi:temperature dependent protein affecting M2 dsRNA replication-domain-containing protein [Bisporella sp. PMI_857]|nr:temperature dependent protein affecting M2 dsRNA replication-domain-containing protein [Bisporella sp. PMI_857]